MESRTFIAYGLALLLTLGMHGCVQDAAPPIVEVQEKYLPLGYNDGIGSAINLYSIWVGNRIYSTWPIRYYELDASLALLKDSVPFAYTETNTWPPIPDSVLRGFFSIRASPDGSTILGIRCLTHELSNGSLEEIDTRTWHTTTILPSHRNVSSAVFVSSDTIVFYTNGNTIGDASAGYYYYIKSTGAEVPLMKYFPHTGEQEVLNGFDYCREKNTLLVPIIRKGQPSIIEVDLKTQKVDTIKVDINPGFERWQLYLRYSKDGTRALYCSYTKNSLSGPAYEPTEIGILTILETPEIRPIIRPGIPDSLSLAMFPDWSPDENHIVFSASRMQFEPFGALEAQRAAILEIR